MLVTLLSGLALGAVYAIVAVGYNIVFIASGILNFAQAQFLMLGTFVALEAHRMAGVPFALAIVLSIAVGAAAGGLEEVLAIRKLGRGAHAELVTTLGAGTIISGIVLAVFGSDAQTVPYLQGLGGTTIFGARTNWVDLIIVGAAVVVAIAVDQVTRRSALGLASRATSEDRQAAQLRGVNVKWLGFGAFVVAAALVAGAGALVGIKTFAVYSLGDDLAVKAFVALTLGGFGSYYGALFGGLAVGVLEVAAARYFGTNWQNIAVFILLLAVLLIAPSGIFTRTRERVV